MVVALLGDMASEALVARPPRWLRTLPWLAGLLIGASAHVVFFSRPAPCESVKVVESAPAAPAPAPTTVHVHVHPAAPPPAARLTPRVAPASRIMKSAATGARGAVVCSAGHCTIRRDFVRRMLERPETLGRVPRLVPTTDPTDGTYLTVLRVSRGSIGYLLGLRNGDALVSIDGHRVSSFEDMLKLHRSLQDAEEFTVTLRHGTALRPLRYTIVGE